MLVSDFGHCINLKKYCGWQNGGKFCLNEACRALCDGCEESAGRHGAEGVECLVGSND